MADKPTFNAMAFVKSPPAEEPVEKTPVAEEEIPTSPLEDNDEELAAADDSEDPKESDEEPGENPEESSTDDEPSSPLEDDEAEEEEEAPKEGESDEEEDDEDSSPLEDKPKKGRGAQNRIAQLVGERNTYKKQVKALSERVAELEKTEPDELTQAATSIYGSFKNPANQMRQDTEFLTALEKLFSSGDIQARAVVAKVNQSLQGRSPIMEDKNEKTPTTKNEKSIEDPRVAYLLKRDAERTVRSTLKDVAQVRNEWVGPISSFVLDNAESLESLDEEQTIALTKKFLRKEGISVKEVLRKSKPKGDETEDAPKAKAKRPPTASGKGAADKDAKGDDEEKGKKGKKPQYKDLDELKAAREERFESLFTELTQTAS